MTSLSVMSRYIYTFFSFFYDVFMMCDVICDVFMIHYDVFMIHYDVMMCFMML